LILESVSTTGSVSWTFGRHNVWARQLDLEIQGAPILNDGGTAWFLGLKTKGVGTLIETKNGGRTEVLGGLSDSSAGRRAEPLFVSRDASISFTIAEVKVGSAPPTVLVREIRGREVRDLPAQDAPKRSGGVIVPLFAGASAR
jgi:hypothetical protein